MYNSIKHLYGVYEKMERDFDIELSEIAVIKESSSDSIFNFNRNARKWDGFIYFAEADGVFSFDGGEQYKIKNSCVFFLREGDRYSVKLNSGYRYITTAYRISNLTGTQLLKIPRMHIASGKEAAIIETANRLWKQKDACGYFAAKVNILSLYLEVIREKSSENQGESKLSLAVEFIKKNYKRNFACSEVAEHAKISESHLRALFRNHMGTSIIDYRESLRAKEARKMISTSLFTLKEIAFELGYNDVYHFTKAFKAACGITPGIYAKSQTS